MEDSKFVETIRNRSATDLERMNENAPETGPAIAVVSSLADFQPLHAAEAKVVAGLGSGDFSRIGNGLCPEGNDPTRIVRAELLRLLILGGGDDFRLHEKGLRLSGAEVTGILDLEGCRIPRDIALRTAASTPLRCYALPLSTICSSTGRLCPVCRPTGWKRVAHSRSAARP